MGHEQQARQQDLRLGQPEVQAALDPTLRRRVTQRPSGPLRPDHRPRLLQRRPHRGGAQRDRRPCRVEHPHLAHRRPPPLGRPEQVGLHRRQHRRALPLQDPGHRGGGLARPRRAHQRHRPPIPSPATKAQTPASARTLGRGLGRHQAAPEPGQHQPARHRRGHQHRRQVSAPGETAARVHPQRPALRGTHPSPNQQPHNHHRHRGGHREGRRRARPIDNGIRQQRRERLRPRLRRNSRRAPQPCRRGRRYRQRNDPGLTGDRQSEHPPGPHHTRDGDHDHRQHHGDILDGSHTISVHDPVGRRAARKVALVSNTHGRLGRARADRDPGRRCGRPGCAALPRPPPRRRAPSLRRARDAATRPGRVEGDPVAGPVAMRLGVG